MYQLIWQYFGKIPIPKILPKELKTLADRMLSLNADLQQLRRRFHNRLTDNFDGVKITGVLEHFDELDFKQFLAALTKQKIKLSLKQQDEWAEYFTAMQTECQALATQIAATDAEIDKMVFALYDLTEEEVAIVEKGDQK